MSLLYIDLRVCSNQAASALKPVSKEWVWNFFFFFDVSIDVDAATPADSPECYHWDKCVKND